MQERYVTERSEHEWHIYDTKRQSRCVSNNISSSPDSNPIAVCVDFYEADKIVKSLNKYAESR